MPNMGTIFCHSNISKPILHILDNPYHPNDIINDMNNNIINDRQARVNFITLAFKLLVSTLKKARATV